MAGYTKHIFEKEVNETRKKINKLIKEIICVLPKEYDFGIVLGLLEEYFPYECFIISEKKKYYDIKERTLVKRSKKSRYSFYSLKDFIESSCVLKQILNDDYKELLKKHFDNKIYIENVNRLKKSRDPKIERIFNKIKKAKKRVQEVEPDYLDSMIGLYERKNTTQKDKVYIMIELQKYYCDKTIRFFSKIVDTEVNRQLRETAFYHLQSFGFQPKLPRQKYISIKSKNRNRRKYLKNIYSEEMFNIKEIPEELEYRIENSRDQSIKEYDYFLSHSSKDFEIVQKLINLLNKDGKTVYCDWINDTDYLKRELLSEATLNVLKKRLEQSKNLLFVRSRNSLQSVWCSYELNFFHTLDKKVYFIDKDNLDSLYMKEYPVVEYLCKDYSKLIVL